MSAMNGRLKAKGRKEDGSRYVGLPLACLQHPNYTALSGSAVKLLLDIYGQFSGYNNGDLCAAWTVMQTRGWRSRDSLERARRELEAYHWIVPTRMGGPRKKGRIPATLWAVTFRRIDECKGKLDVSESREALGTWKSEPDLSLLRPPRKRKVASQEKSGLTRNPATFDTDSSMKTGNSGAPTFLRHGIRVDRAPSRDPFDTVSVLLTRVTNGGGLEEDREEQAEAIVSTQKRGPA